MCSKYSISWCWWRHMLPWERCFDACSADIRLPHNSSHESFPMWDVRSSMAEAVKAIIAELRESSQKTFSFPLQRKLLGLNGRVWKWRKVGIVLILVILRFESPLQPPPPISPPNLPSIPSKWWWWIQNDVIMRMVTVMILRMELMILRITIIINNRWNSKTSAGHS